MECLGKGKHQETAVPSFLFCSHFKITYGHNNAATLPPLSLDPPAAATPAATHPETTFIIRLI